MPSGAFAKEFSAMGSRSCASTTPPVQTLIVKRAANEAVPDMSWSGNQGRITNKVLEEWSFLPPATFPLHIKE